MNPLLKGRKRTTFPAACVAVALAAAGLISGASVAAASPSRGSSHQAGTHARPGLGLSLNPVTSAPPAADTITVTSPGTLTGGLGTAVSEQLSAISSTGAPIVAWAATGLPPGLSIDGSTGNITGTLITAGTFTVTVTATDRTGFSGHNSGQAIFAWLVTLHAPGACGKQLIGDGGFETGLPPWSATAGVRVRTASRPAPPRRCRSSSGSSPLTRRPRHRRP